MDKTQTLKIVSFVLSIVMLVVALTAIVCLFALPNPLNNGNSGDDSDTNNDETGNDNQGQAGEQLGIALVLILIIPLVLTAMFVHAAYSVATLVLNIRQLFAGKNRKIALLVMNIVSVLWLALLTLACITSNPPLLHAVFHVFVAVSLALAIASLVIDIVLIKSTDGKAQAQQ